jgi:cyclomaltodextrinase
MTDRERYAIWWHVYPLGFLGAEPQATGGPPVHRLRHLVDWLDYARDLGASGLALGPVFASETHGYDTVDHFRIDPRLGDDADFDALVAAAGERGLRVLLDGVFNHVGRGFPAFAQVLEQGPSAPTASWFRLSWPDGPGAEPEYAAFEGHSQLVALNHDEPAVVDHVVAVMDHWLARGAAGWRLDAAYAVPRVVLGAGGAPRPRRPPRRLPGGRGDPRRLRRVRRGERDRLGHPVRAVEGDLELAQRRQPVRAVLGARPARRAARRLRAADLRRQPRRHPIASRLTDERHLPHALAVLFTVGGTPSVYAGDEQAFRGVKEDRAGGDDAVRPAFPDTPDGLAPFGWPTYRLHQDLIGLRRRHPWLHRARTRVVELDNRRFCYEVRDGDRALLVALNLDDAPADLPAPSAGEVLAGGATVGEGRVSVPGHGWAILSTSDQLRA